jgi:flagellar motor switch protein FliM
MSIGAKKTLQTGGVKMYFCESCEIAYDSLQCPLCDLKEKSQKEINELKDKIKNIQLNLKAFIERNKLLENKLYKLEG